MDKGALLAGVLALTMLTVGLAPTAAAEDQTLFVDDDGIECPDAGYSSIQAAVDDAEAGDKVAVCQGVYDETLEIDTPFLTLCGVGPDAESCGIVCTQVTPTGCDGPTPKVTIDATGNEAEFVVLVDAGDVTIQGLSIVAGVAQSGVDVRDGSALLQGNEIVSTATDDDGGLRTIGVNVVGGQATVVNNRLAGWIANAVGVWRGDATVSGNTFVDNRVGVHLSEAADGTLVEANTFAAHLWPVRVAGQAAGLTVQDNDLGPTNAFAFRIEPDVGGLEVDAPDNWWGVLGCAAIQERVDNANATTSVDVTPYRGPNGNVIGSQGLLDVSSEDPTCEA